MRPTRAGIGIAVIIANLMAIGRSLGLFELYLIGTMMGIALLIAVAFTGTVRLNLSIDRTITPTHIRANTPLTVKLAITNNSKRRTPLLLVKDHFDNSPGAKVLMAPISKKQKSKVSYRLPALGRGEFTLGPVDLTYGDPLGLTTMTIKADQVNQLLIHPELITLAPLETLLDNRVDLEQSETQPQIGVGNEFFALREYVVGDDLRRVHWRASARLDDLVVRQDQQPRLNSVSLLLDLSPDAYTEAGFERAVSASLSTLYASFNGKDPLTFLTTETTTTTKVNSTSELNALDTHLALIKTNDSVSLAQRLNHLNFNPAGGLLIVITGKLSKHSLNALSESANLHSQMLLISCEPSATKTTNPFKLITYDKDENLALLWRQAITELGQTRSNTTRARLQ